VRERLDALGIEPEEGLLILKREVQREGRNRAWVNGSPATATVVGELGTALVDLHGQHEHQTLLRTDEQRAVLDAFAGVEELAREVAGRHARLAELRRRLEAGRERRRELEARADFLRFQAGEIEEARLDPEEEEALDAEGRRLEHARELAEGAERIHLSLYGGDDAVSDRLAEVRSLLRRLAGFDSDLEDGAALLEEAYHQVVEVGRRLGDYAGDVEHDPRRLDEIGRRQDLLFRLKRKYGPELPDVIETGRRVRAELDELESAEHDLGELEAELARAREELEATAAELGRARREAADRLTAEIESILPSLGMEGAVFRVHFTPLDSPGAGGGERVEFLVSLNPGFEPRGLRHVASGGELSRVMLALKAILARVDRVPTLVFDEVDAGIGGVVATGVAAKLAEVAGEHQVFVITHLPQLASRARGHLRVEKASREGLAAARVVALEGEERVTEIARMLGGDPGSDRSREHARELLQAV
jgi:DNA repair protein RecN (Recombination protein N)